MHDTYLVKRSDNLTATLVKFFYVSFQDALETGLSGRFMVE